MTKLDKLISQTEQQQIVAAIARAEKATSGQIRVHVEPKCAGGDPYKRAVAVFEKLGMTATSHRNGVLIYVAINDRKFSVIGDRGIHEHVGESFWQDTAAALRGEFVKSAHGAGIVAAIELIGERLAAHFPHTAADRDELPNNISTNE